MAILPDFKTIKTNVGMEQVLTHYDLLASFKRKGNQLTGCCPIHQGTNKDQFSVNIERNCWNCFGDCKTGGNVLDFVAALESVSLKEAGCLLSDWFNIPALQRERPTRKNPSQSKNQPQKSLVREKKRGAAAKVAPSGSPDVINPPLSFKLTHLDPEHPYLKGRGLRPETIKHFGLGYCSKGLMKNRIAIPVHNEKGELIAYAGRAVDAAGEEDGKYKLPAKFQKGAEVFNLHRAKEFAQAQGLVLVEGYFDVFWLYQAGYPNVAALMGSSMSEQQEALIVAAVGQQGKIILLFDNDEAGLKCQQDVSSRLVKSCFVRAVKLPDGITQPDQLPKDKINLF